MDRLDYLREVSARGQREAAATAEAAAGVTAYHGFDSFQGLYYDLANMELAAAGESAPPLRVFSIDKALDRLDTRLDCADFAIPALVRMLRAHRGTPRLPEEVAARIERSLINFKYWLDEPGEVHACFFTENHQILYHSAEYLAGQLFPDAVFPNNGMTGRQHMAHGETFLRRWLKWRVKFGFAEWLTQGYYADDILGLVNLMLYADSEDIRADSRMLIDALALDLATHGFHGHLPTTHGRVYAGFIIDPEQEDCSQLMRLLFGEGSQKGLCGAAVMLAACGYDCPRAIVNAYHSCQGVQTMRQRMSVDAADAAAHGVDPKDFDNIMFFWGMQTYSDRVCIENSLKVFPQWNWMTNRVKAYLERYRLCDEAGAPCPDAPDFTAMTQVDIYTRRTPDYILSCAQDFRKGRMGYQQHPWTASLGGRAVVFTTNPASLEYQNRPNRWAGNLCLPRAAAHENVLFCIYRILPDFVDYLYSHLYFPRHEMDESFEKDGWLFGRRGDGYIAVRSLEPAYWEPKDSALFRAVYPDEAAERFAAAQDYEYIAQGHANVWVVEMGSRAENGSFDAFAARFADASLRGDTHAFTYRSPSQGEMTFGWGKPLTVAGSDIPLHGYARYDTPFCHADFGAERYDIVCGGSVAALDFSGHTRRV